MILIAAPALFPVRLFAASAIDDLTLGSPFTGLAVPAPRAAEAAPASGVFDGQADRIYYLSPWQVDMSQVPAAPAAGSDADKEDLAVVRRWQVERTEAQCQAAKAQTDATYDDFFGAVSPFGNPAADEVEKIFSKVRTDTGSIVYLLKEKYKRPRPFLRDPALTPCIAKASGYSYPSGHAATARVFGLMLSALVPANAGTYMRYADLSALNRVISGVHHPSDIEAGKTLGDAIYKALRQNNNFNADMDTLRRDLKR